MTKNKNWWVMKHSIWFISYKQNFLVYGYYLILIFAFALQHYSKSILVLCFVNFSNISELQYSLLTS